MKRNMLRTVQIGIALIVLACVTLAILVLTGVIAQDEAMRVARNVSAVIALCVAAGIVLMALFGLGKVADREP